MDQGFEFSSTAGVDSALHSLNADINNSANELHVAELAAKIDKYQLLSRHRQNVVNLASALAVASPRTPQEKRRDTIDTSRESCAMATIKNPVMSTQQQPQSQSQHYEDMNTEDEIETDKEDDVQLGDEEEEEEEEEEKEGKGKAKKVLYTDDESRIVWQFGEANTEKDWEKLAAEARKNPKIFDPVHANAKSLQYRWNWMTRTSESRCKFGSQLWKNRGINRGVKGGMGKRKPRGGQRGNVSRRKYSNAESSIVWRFGVIDGRKDWQNLATRVSKMDDIFDRSHTSVESLKKKYFNMTDPNVVERYRVKYGADRKAHRAKGWDKHPEL